MAADPPAPLGLVGYSAAAARALREFGLLAFNLPERDLGELLPAALTLGLSGVLVHPSQEESAYAACLPDDAARQAGRVDAVSLIGGAFGGQALGSHSLAEALSDAVLAARYAALGSSALMVGHGADLAAALPLTRLGFSQVSFVADSPDTARRLCAEVPAGVKTYAVSRHDAAAQSLAERADLVVLTAGALPGRWLQPFHMVLDLTGRLNTAASGATALDLSALAGLRLARQLAHVTGQRYRPEDIDELARVLLLPA
ncbi:shikimate dehydrogenase [Deinococcus lacus]|uniref:Shikimate dehydrogenase n=1 Tax=Deinococcus lacus TaxID=392561 RepID=A0ABW1Y9X3_9DEIO